MTAWWRDFGAARFERPASPRPIVRPALLARLDRAFAERAQDSGQPGGRPVVTVVADSGAGKSTLLQQWAEVSGALIVQGAYDAEALREAGAVVVLDGVEWSGAVGLIGVVPLVLSGREPIPVAAVDRLGAGHLVFAEDETYQVLAAALADAAGADGLAPDLHLLTGGWPALVGLAAAWLARLPAGERDASLRQLARVDGPLQDHLVGLLIAVLHHEEREFVRRLAHLPAIDAAAAGALGLTEELGGLPPIVLPVVGSGGSYGVPEALRETIQQRLPLAEHERRALLEAFQGM